MIRIAFTVIGGEQWKGGHNYLCNLLDAICTYGQGRIRPCLLIGVDFPDKAIADFARISGLEIHRHPCLNRSKATPLLVRSLIFGRDRLFQRWLDDLRIDLVFESARFFGWKLKQASVAWFPDFQHRLMPEMFPTVTYWRREIGFLVQILSGRSIMVSSEDAAAHFKELYRLRVAGLYPVRFSVRDGASLQGISHDTLRTKYGLPRRYFFLPNQFWRHKNHRVVVDALNILKQQRTPATVVCTGSTDDPRAPTYFQDLMSRVDELGLADSFRVLGVLPYPDMVGLMLGASAMINPSLFEGWSTPVEEARASGVPMLLSKLSVHVEQAGDVAVFFDPCDPEQLAERIQEVLAYSDEELNIWKLKVRASAEGRREAFANSFFRLVENAVRRSV